MCYNNAKKANRSKEMARKSRYIEKNKLKKEEYNMTNERISMKLKGMSPVQYRTHSQAS